MQFLKTKDDLTVYSQKTNWLWHKYCKIKLFSDTILHCLSNKPEAYLEPSQTSMTGLSAEIVNSCKSLTIFAVDELF